MKTLLTSILVLLSVMLFVVPASATVIWDGSGDITTHGYTLNGGPAFQYDYEGDGVHPAVPHVGTMYELSVAATASYTLNTAASELVNANGWTVETRVQSLYNDQDWDVFFQARDNTGGFGLWLYPNAIHVGPGDWSDVTSYITGLSSGYHTIRAVVAPGASSASIYVDNMVTAAATVALLGGTTPRLEFGDVTTTGSGNANWDYVNVNASAPEPGTLVLLLTGLIGLLCYAWRKRK